MLTSAIRIEKQTGDSSLWQPLERGTAMVRDRRIARVTISDGARRRYVDAAVGPSRRVAFAARGAAGLHAIEGFDRGGKAVASLAFRLAPRTRLWCDRGPYAELAQRVQTMLLRSVGSPWVINGRRYHMLVSWGRDHMHTLKAQKYFMDDVKSGLEYWLETQEPNGMFWDTIAENPDYPGRSWLGEALGKGWFWYDDHMKYVVRRIPVEADCEFMYTEGVWYAWKASGDDAWMAAQLPKLEKALEYNNSHPDRWSRKHGLVRRSFCMDSWDFANPRYCNGDHRCINPGDPQFLFHSDNSGLYASYWRMAEMYEHLGRRDRAKELRREGEALRARANRKLFFGNVYGHMIPETLPPEKVYAEVGDERKRMSLSTGYTINRKLPTHAMAVKIIREYQRRREQKRGESFAEWWTMDPPYLPGQWGDDYAGTGGCTVGEYMNGAICTIIAGEIAKAAFDHGCEDYGADILRRVWDLSERDGGDLYQVYRRLPERVATPKAAFQPISLAAVANRGLRHRGRKAVPAWTDEGHNDMRNLPVGRRRFGIVEFDVADPAKNGGRSVVALRADTPGLPASVTIPAQGQRCASVYFLHCTMRSVPKHAVAGSYRVAYADGSCERIWIRNGHEIGHWWGVSADAADRKIARVAWEGANPTWKHVGVHMFGWDNPHPDRAITAITAEALPTGGQGGGIMLCAVSLCDGPVRFDTPIRSYGLPDCWAQAAVYYAVAEGLAGIEDEGRAFSRARIAPRWAATESARAEATLHYPASDGYCSCAYRHERRKRRIVLDMTGSFETASVHCLLPGKAKAVRVTVDGVAVGFANRRVERSSYVDFELLGLPRSPAAIEYR